MTKFLLDTGAVDTVADSLKELANNARDVMRSVSKYDVDNEDSFNFSGAKDAISTNVSSAYIKFRLTNQYLKKVVTTHTELQESVNGSGNGNGGGGVSYLGNNYYGGGYYGGVATGAGGGITFAEETIKSPNGEEFKAGTISLAILKQLFESGVFTDETIKKLNLIDEKVLVITISKTDPNFEDKLELAEELSKVYDIDLVINDKDEEDIETSLCIVKNGIVLASTEDLTDIEAIKTMFNKVNMDVEDKDIDIEPLPEDKPSDEKVTEENNQEETGKEEQSGEESPTDSEKEDSEGQNQNTEETPSNENDDSNENNEPTQENPSEETDENNETNIVN